MSKIDLPYRSKPILKDPNGLLPTDFNSLSDLARLDNSFPGAKKILMTEEGWKKYNNMLTPPSEIEYSVKENN